MLVKKDSLNVAMAKQCMNPYDVSRKAGISYQTFRKLRNGQTGKPATIGRIAAALGVDVTEIIESSEKK